MMKMTESKIEMNYEHMAKLLYFIEKYSFQYMCQLVHYVKSDHPDLLPDLETHRLLFVKYLCKLRGF